MIRARRWILPALLGLAGCNRSPAPAAREAPAGSASSAQAEAAPPQAKKEPRPAEVLPTLSVEADHVFFGTTRIERDDGGRLAKVQGLFDAIGGPREARYQPLSTRGPPAYELRVSATVPLLWLKSAFQTAAFAGLRPARLNVRNKWLHLDAAIPGPPETEPVPPERAFFPDPALILTVEAASTKLWRAKRSARSDDPPPSSELVASLASDATWDQLHAAFVEKCAKHPCSPGVLYTENGIPFSRLEPVLAAFTMAAAVPGAEDPLLVFHLAPVPEGPLAPKLPESVQGRLPAKVIQAKIRAEFEQFRRCYEAGLAKNPQLAGRISVRFVINTEGGVDHVELKENTLPSAVSKCVTTEFSKLEFPRPVGGVVTVTYPLVFSPE